MKFRRAALAHFFALGPARRQGVGGRRDRVFREAEARRLRGEVQIAEGHRRSGSGGSPFSSRSRANAYATLCRSPYWAEGESARTLAWGRPSTSAATQPPYSAASRTMRS